MNRCAECGSELSPGVPLGLCPHCALQAAVSAESQGQTASVNLALPTAQPGDHIGRYKLLQQIGEGGCGVVFMAEQEEPIRRKVALKVIKLGMDTRSVIARFEAERQALALMDHPNIAKVFDAGATETGRPYFVMELVRGVRITDYCDQHNLTTTARLDLFTQVCHAIQHAHQKGIIHRDIKPSNILVTLHDGVPVPKVIDFGIAKATSDQRLTDKTLFTAFEQFMGTPAYMSPEQAEMSGLDIDTRSDIYSLGVLLYELLTGKTPFDGKELLAAGLDKMRRTIREEEPARPSNRLNTLLEADRTEIAKRRQTEPGQLTTLLRGDLDWIVMKALEKDRTRRYDSANGLAADIERHLHNEPVVACPPTTLYRMRTFIRRNRGLVAATAAIALVLVLGAVTSAWQWRRVEQARRAEAELRKEAEAKAEAESKAKEESNQRQVSSVQFSRDGTRIITIFSNNTARIWDVATGQPLWLASRAVQGNKEIVRRYFEEWANRGDAAVADQLIATNFVLRNPPAVIRSLEDYKNGMAKFHSAFPDARYTVEDQIAEGDKVVVCWTLRATQALEYQGHPPNGKTMTVTGISIFRLADGKIQEITVNMNRLGQMEQLGWLPPATPQPQ